MARGTTRAKWQAHGSMKACFAIATLLLVASCASAPGSTCVRLSSSGWFCPLPPAALAPRTAAALVTVSRAHNVDQYLGQLVVTAHRLTLALTSLAGIPLATISWDGRQIEIRPKRSSFKPGLMTALLEFTIAPPSALQSNLHGLKLAIERTPTGSDRRVTSNGKLVVLAHLSSSATNISVPRMDLKITLEPVDGSSP